MLQNQISNVLFMLACIQTASYMWQILYKIAGHVAMEYNIKLC